MKRPHNYGFTLIEILIAMTISMLLISIAAYAQINMNEATRRSTASASLHLQSSALIKKIREDFGGMQPHCAVHFHVSGTSATTLQTDLTFMRGVPWEMDASGAVGNVSTVKPPPYTVSAKQARQWFHELVWVRWQFDENNGLRRAISPKIGSTVTSSNTSGKGDSPSFFNGKAAGLNLANTANRNGRAVIPQRQYKYFDNQGDSNNPTTAMPSAQCYAFIYDWDGNSTSHFGMRVGNWFNNAPYKDALFMYNNAEGKHYFLGNTTPINNAYAAALPYPNRPNEHQAGYPILYNRNKIDLLGIPGDEKNSSYPSLLAPVSSAVEMFSMKIELKDGTLLQQSASTINESLDGVRMTPEYYKPGTTTGLRSTSDGERSYIQGKRPKFLRVTFVIHNMPVDPSRPYKENPLSSDFPGENLSSIHYLRYYFYDVLPASDQSHATFKRMIEAAGFTAHIVTQSILLY